MFKSLSLAFIIAMGLTACAHNPLDHYVNFVSKQIDTTYESYTNQLVTENQPHATIKIYPFVSSFGYTRFETMPINIKQIDDTVVIQKNTLSAHYELATPFWDLKVPTGVHSVIVGQKGNSRHNKFSMNFEQGKKYAIKFESHGLAVYEYEHDSRFNDNTKESIILKQEVKLMDKTIITWKKPQPLLND